MNPSSDPAIRAMLLSSLAQPLTLEVTVNIGESLSLPHWPLISAFNVEHLLKRLSGIDTGGEEVHFIFYPLDSDAPEPEGTITWLAPGCARASHQSAIINRLFQAFANEGL